MAEVKVKIVVESNGKAQEFPMEDVDPSKNYLKFKIGSFDEDGKRGVVGNVYLLKDEFKK
jgi:uncharacterized protein YggU (UPF0235/DUF167 family)